MASLDGDLRHYRCWVFDCDGVLLDSNKVKTAAFYAAAMPYGDAVAQRLVKYHVANGGVSRFRKFEYLFDGILKRAPDVGEMEDVLSRFAASTRAGLLECDEAPGLRDFLGTLPEDAPRVVVSGGAQDELRWVFAERGLGQFFTAIFGSPDSKEQILYRERRNGLIRDPGVLIGDSRYDYEVAAESGLDFIFAHRWSEFSQWPAFFAGRSVMVVEAIGDLMSDCDATNDARPSTPAKQKRTP